MRLAIGFILLTVLFSSLGALPAAACSGGPTPLDWLIERSDHLIRARILESDRPAQNHVAQVEMSYFGGMMPEMILISQNSPSSIQGLLDDSLGGGDCHHFEPSPDVGEAFYMFVAHAENGSYDQVGGLFSPYFYTFPDSNSVMPIESFHWLPSLFYSG